MNIILKIMPTCYGHLLSLIQDEWFCHIPVMLCEEKEKNA